MCLLLRPDQVEARISYWRERSSITGRTPAKEFLLGKVPLTRILSPNLWVDTWAAYAHYDRSYTDRGTFAFIADAANGIATPVPTLILYAAYSLELLPAVPAGILGVMLFWQLMYNTAVYSANFFVANRHTRISRRDVYVVWAFNSPWVLFPLLGLYVSVRLILDGNYSVLG